MEYIMLAGGIVVTAIGVCLMDSEGTWGTVATLMVVFGMLLLCGGVMKMKPIEVEAEERMEEKVRGAGVTAHMNATLRNALREPPLELTLTNEEEISLLARLITAETGGTDEYLSYLTGSVVINRMNSDKFPKTLFGVVYQAGQYECTWNGHIYKPYTDLAWEIAEELLTYGTTIDEKVVYQSESTHGSGVYKQIGRTYFCYE